MKRASGRCLATGHGSGEEGKRPAGWTAAGIASVGGERAVGTPDKRSRSMHKLMTQKAYLFGLVFAVAIVCANVIVLVEPCGFKWGG